MVLYQVELRSKTREEITHWWISWGGVAIGAGIVSGQISGAMGMILGLAIGWAVVMTIARKIKLK